VIKLERNYSDKNWKIHKSGDGILIQSSTNFEINLIGILSSDLSDHERINHKKCLGQIVSLMQFDLSLSQRRSKKIQNLFQQF